VRKIPIVTVLTAGVLVTALLIYAFRFQVRFNEVAVKVRLGRADATSIVQEPGVYFRWPWPIERVETFDRRLQVTDVPESETKTLDGKNLIVGLYAVWRIQDPLQFYVRVGSIREAEEKMRARLNQARAAAVGQAALATFVSLDREQVDSQFEKLEQQMLAEAGPGLTADFGVTLERVGIRRISLPEQVTQEVFNSMRVQRDRIAQAYKEEGASRRKAIEARADSAVASILAFAESKAKQIEAEGQRAAARILGGVAPEYQDFFIWLRRIEALKAALAQRSTIFLDSGSDLMRDFVTPPGAPAAAPPSEAARPPQAQPESPAASAAAEPAPPADPQSP
jgi:membrane protease subunit HflC